MTLCLLIIGHNDMVGYHHANQLSKPSGADADRFSKNAYSHGPYSGRLRSQKPPGEKICIL